MAKNCTIASQSAGRTNTRSDAGLVLEQAGGGGDGQHVADVGARHAEGARQRGDGDRDGVARDAAASELAQGEAAHQEQSGIAVGQFRQDRRVGEDAEAGEEIYSQVAQEGGAVGLVLEAGGDEVGAGEDWRHSLELPGPIALMRGDQFRRGGEDAPAMIGRVGAGEDVAAEAHGGEDRCGASGAADPGLAA